MMDSAVRDRDVSAEVARHRERFLCSKLGSKSGVDTSPTRRRLSCERSRLWRTGRSQTNGIQLQGYERSTRPTGGLRRGETR